METFELTDARISWSKNCWPALSPPPSALSAHLPTWRPFANGPNIVVLVLETSFPVVARLTSLVQFELTGIKVLFVEERRHES